MMFPYHILILFLFHSSNKILIDSYLAHVFLLLFFLFRDLGLKLGLPLFLSWLKKSCKLGCFCACDSYYIYCPTK